MTTTHAAYDQHAAWYEDFVTGNPYTQLVSALLTELLGTGTGLAVELGCGTGIHADTVRATGRTPIGFDISAGQLGFAAGRLPVARADVAAIPLPDASVSTVIAVLIHTDVPDYPAALREAARILKPGGRFVHIGVHPCFTGAFSDRSDPARVIITSELYGHTGVSFESWSPNGVRARVGARHLPIADLINATLAAGLTLTTTAERGQGPLPDLFGIAATRS
ncbi:class I SAM-dependent methyltransferase [Longispora albida]|uniref:class I SAM-dependent methyltransferase n=1 Tax=Longispora albida TaxID=203523 RepID=UPI00037F26C4|nr:class I SAM-dependent methyltransferase [Longispora albida]